MERVMGNYVYNTNTGQWAIAPGANDYALSYTNLNRGGGALNAYGQPVGTLAPMQRTRQFSNNPQRIGGTVAAPTAEELQQSLNSITKNIQNFRYTGKQGSYTAARSGRRLKLMKRRKGLLSDALSQLGTPGYGTSGAGVGGMAQWG